MMKRVVLTGASGFIGRHVISHLLERGFQVHAVSRADKLADSRVIWHQVDLFNPEAAGRLFATVRPELLLHMAWCTEAGTYWTSPENFRWVQTSLSLLEHFARQGGKRVVFAGSCAEYDWDAGELLENVSPVSTGSPYSACKNALCILLEAFCRQADMSYAWGRIFHLFGPHEHEQRFVPYVIRSLLQDNSVNCETPDDVRDYMYVDDVAGAFAALLDSRITGIINIASGKPVLIRDLVQKLATAAGKTHLVNYNTAQDRISRVMANTRRLNHELQWTQRYTLDDALGKTIDWWRAQKMESVT